MIESGIQLEGAENLLRHFPLNPLLPVALPCSFSRPSLPFFPISKEVVSGLFAGRDRES